MAPMEDEGLGAGDTFVVRELLQGEGANITIDELLREVELGPMYIGGRELERPGTFIAAPVEGSAPGTRPILRCPSSGGIYPRLEGPLMRRLRLAASRAAGVEFNSAKVQLYRTRQNKINMHADKVVDMSEDEAFASFRLGAARAFALSLKADSSVEQSIHATSNSLIVVGPRTNREWLHGVRPDRRRDEACSEEELADDGRSVSIIFRRAITFLREDGFLFGEGARYKTEAALEAAIATARASGAPMDLGAPQDEIQALLVAAWGRDNRLPSARRADLYGHIIQASVRWSWEQEQAPAAKGEVAKAVAEVKKKIPQDFSSSAAACLGGLYLWVERRLLSKAK